ncbi:Hypothetical predicted protein [Mytilus galloprovincialis]|uniref:Uncharacterized protein n=1 Tax=Mytilus galloprovincialis TaxID=29158 RepID=A0A8B6DNM0_MYTGA|nr:Hypothetical predicted protein [Mytilus galloprovincialis]
MAQVLAVPGHVRHGFSYVGQFNHDFGRITGIAASIKGNILLCDYDNKNMTLVDPLGNYLKKLDLDSEPYEVAITSQNIGYITQPNSRSVLQIDPDRMMVLLKSTCKKLRSTVFCVSAIQNTGRDFSDKASGFLGVKECDGTSHAIAVKHDKFDLTRLSYTGYIIGLCFVKFHAVNEKSSFSCIGGQNYIMYHERGYTKKIDNIATLDTPTDICSDDNGHIYVSGQGSNNIHRLERYLHKEPWETSGKTAWKLLDIPLDLSHGVKEPVALCFNHEYSKLYIVNEWGKSVLVFEVI